ncbi:hypothetical protein HRbin16_01482 [bacterium HR16]|nr:hypothetical protein HRbin16_01482 [bacterium HR16]
MSSSLSEEQIVQMVKQLPLGRKREIAALIEQDLAEERRRRQALFRAALSRISKQTGKDWSQLTPEQQAQIILSHYRELVDSTDALQGIRWQVEPVVREAARQRGYDWDAMSEDERIAFFSEWIDD